MSEPPIVQVPQGSADRPSNSKTPQSEPPRVSNRASGAANTVSGVANPSAGPSQLQSSSVTGNTPAGKSQLQSLLNKRWLMFVTLFGVTAVLGIPLLWKSEAFSKREKMVWSCVVVLYTFFIFWIFFEIMAWCYGQISSSLS